MRLVQVTVPAGKRDAVLDALDDEGVDYVVTDETSGRDYTAVVHFPIPTQGVEDIARRAAVRRALARTPTRSSSSAETVVSGRFDAARRNATTTRRRTATASPARNSSRAPKDLAPRRRTYVVMTLVSTVIATAGLLLDSPATVVGSMVIAPLLGPAMAASVGTVVDDDDLFARGVRLQVVGVLLAVVGAAAFAFLAEDADVVPPGLDVLRCREVSERLRAGLPLAGGRARRGRRRRVSAS
ncbi:MAG: DUF389 domain-containing protein [Gammaproteobacteria bacterium]|nr:DUF389 domain-containing protein [Gammaproteobacteria bacterium]